MNKTIFVTKSSMPSFDEYVNEIKDIWDTHMLTNLGTKHQKLQKQLEEYLGCKNVDLFTNGHLALEAIIESFNFPKGSEIITTPFTFASTTHAIVRKGLTPVFCDINDKDYTIDADKIESLITEKTVAILPVHVYGNMCDVEKIESVCKKHKLVVIYDAAHAFGVKYKGISSACFGNASMFSFHATKVFNTIEGGCICHNNDELIYKLFYIKDFGLHGPENCVYSGGNAKMNEFQAAMGICNLKHIEEEINKRKIVYHHYLDRLDGIEGIKLCKTQENVTPNYAYFPVVFDNYKYTRDEIFEILKENNIFARKYFYPVVNEFDCYKDIYQKNQTPIAKYIGDRVLTLPMYADLDLHDVDLICDLILK